MLVPAGGALLLALLLLWLFALVDCISTEAVLCRNLPKLLWIVVIVVLPDVGAVLWLLFGRPVRRRWAPRPTDFAEPRRPIAIEDSPRYGAVAGVTDRRSAELDRQIEEWEARRRERDDAERDVTDE